MSGLRRNITLTHTHTTRVHHTFRYVLSATFHHLAPPLPVFGRRLQHSVQPLTRNYTHGDTERSRMGEPRSTNYQLNHGHTCPVGWPHQQISTPARQFSYPESASSRPRNMMASCSSLPSLSETSITSSAAAGRAATGKWRTPFPSPPPEDLSVEDRVWAAVQRHRRWREGESFESLLGKTGGYCQEDLCTG